ncbi:WXG100 family type VII secretion target [Metabacillus sp. 84]|uniref:WXG100 family type VII secretion target n=1 Tax=Metabacillus sp. 84 TaxID=3404705 RepID=UPI003CF4CDD3
MPDVLEMEARRAEREEIRRRIESLRDYKADVEEGLDELEKAKKGLHYVNDQYASDWKGKAAEAYKEVAAELKQLETNMDQAGKETVDEIDREISRLLQEYSQV